MPYSGPPPRQSDYGRFPSSTPLVIDNGGSTFRIGWAGESDPRVSFRNIVHRPRHKATGETVSIVGDHDLSLLKYFDCTRSFPRSPFDCNVVYQFEYMEYILDYGFERMGADAMLVEHPVLMTECVCNPLQSRSKMAELLFETYGVPSVAFGVDAAFSYKHNQRLGFCQGDGLAVSTGFNASHIIPFINGEPVIESCCRTNIGGYHSTYYLRQLLSLKYPYHIPNLTWEKVEDLKLEHCYIAEDYASELQLFQKGGKEAEEKSRYWQLPWVPSPQEEQPSEEDIARKAALKEKQGERLRSMAAARKSSKISDLETERKDLEFLLEELESVEEEDVQSFLAETGYVSKEEIESAFAKVTQSLRKAKGETVEVDESVDSTLAEKYSLLDVPDDMLTPEQVKEKRKQVFLKMTSEGRQRARQKRLDEELQRERQNQEEEDRRLENPELYLEELRAKHRELSERVDQRKRLKTNGSRTNGNNQTSTGPVGRGERLNAAQKERMRLLATAAFDKGKGEDTFGARDEDWQLYKLMSRDDDEDDEGPDEVETELARVTSRLLDIDADFVAHSDVSSLPHIEPLHIARPMTEEDFRIVLGVERFRCPEVLFQPSMVGVDQAGLEEMVGISFRRLQCKDETVHARMTSSILLTGGSCLFPGMNARMEAGVRKIRPYMSPIRVVRASDPILDAWRGAANFAASQHFINQTFTRQDFDEYGENWLHKHQLRYSLW